MPMLAGLLFKGIEKQALPGVVFKAGRCLRSRLQGHACEDCLAVCPRQALTLENDRIVLAAERCTGCHACVTACPGNALTGGFDLSSLPTKIARDNDEAASVLGCDRSPMTPNLTRLPCLGLLTEPVLAGLHCLAKKEILLDARSCPACENRQTLDLLRERIRGVAGKAAPCGLRLRLADTTAFAGRDDDNSRRSFLRMTKTSLLVLSRRTAEMLPETGGAPDQPVAGEKTATPVGRFLSRVVALLPGGAEAEQDLLRKYHFQLKAGDDCNLCPACSGMCPTGALKREKRDEKKRLYFVSAKCSGCGLCVKFCKKQALAISPGGGNDPATTRVIAQQGELSCSAQRS